MTAWIFRCHKQWSTCDEILRFLALLDSGNSPETFGSTLHSWFGPVRPCGGHVTPSELKERISVTLTFLRYWHCLDMDSLNDTVCLTSFQFVLVSPSLGFVSM